MLVAAPEWPQVLLPHGYPGVIHAVFGPGLNHVVVAWADLEEHPESFAMGYDHDSSGRYNLLVPKDDAEWLAALDLASASNFETLGWKSTGEAT